MKRYLKESYEDHVRLKPDLTVIKKIMEQQEKAMILNDDARYRQVYGQDVPCPTFESTWGDYKIQTNQTTILPIK